MARCRDKFQTDESDEVIAGRIFTKLERKITPCTVNELCSQENEERFDNVLELMCINGIVTKVGKKYVLPEKLYSSKVKQQQWSNPSSPVKASVCEAFPPLSPTREFVRVQQRPSQMEDVKTTARKHRDDMKQIVKVIEKNQKDSADIAQQTGIERAKVDRYLHWLKHKEVLSINDRHQWKLIRAVRDKELMEYGVELSKTPGFEPKEEPLPDRAAASTAATAAAAARSDGRPINIHIHNNYEYNYNYNYYTQIGDYNKMNVRR